MCYDFVATSKRRRCTSSHAVSPAEAYSNLGFVLAVQGKKPEALAAYRKALELEPALKIAYAAVQRLEAPEAPVATGAVEPK